MFLGQARDNLMLALYQSTKEKLININLMGHASDHGNGTIQDKCC